MVPNLLNLHRLYEQEILHGPNDPDSEIYNEESFDKSDGLTCGSPVKMETSPSVEPQAKTKPNSAGAN